MNNNLFTLNQLVYEVQKQNNILERQADAFDALVEAINNLNDTILTK